MKHCGTQELETGRLLLRRLTVDDSEMMFNNWASDPEVTRYLRWNAHRSWAETAEMLNEWEKHYGDPTFYQWGVENKRSGVLMGTISLFPAPELKTGWHLNTEILGSAWEAGYALGRKWWNNGYMTEALCAVRDYWFNTVDAPWLVAIHANENVASSAVLQKAGVPPLILADGPAGLRVSREYFMRDGRLIPLPLERCFESGYLAQDCPEPDGEKFYQFCTAFPIGTMLAQSWDTALLQAVGHAVGREMEVYRVALWLAPGMNLHRDPLCGRNFEYFSEDPLLSGRMAAAMTAGVQSVPGRGTTVKHFACNNLENDRVELNSIVSERALRELYLKGFEIALRSPTPPAAVMTAYNLVNGVHAANSYALCTVLAREEWGYRGVLMTDWDSTGSRRCTAVGCMLAGNELLMPGCRRDYDELLDAVRAGKLPRAALQQCAARVIAAARQLQR